MPRSDFIWPAIFRPDGRNLLVRIGSRYDGGYIIPAAVVPEIEQILTFGLGLNWDFEHQMSHLSPAHEIHCYDHTVTPARMRKIAALSLLKYFFKTAKRRELLRIATHYFRFFGDAGKARHFQMMVGTADSEVETSVAAAFARLPGTSDRVLLKCDIKGGEYALLGDLIAHAPRCAVIAIEFHDCGFRMAEITDAVSQLRNSHWLDHFHINNCSEYGPDDVPSVIELTFSRKDLDGAAKLPSNLAGLPTSRDGTELDAPNDPNLSPVPTRFELES